MRDKEKTHRYYTDNTGYMCSFCGILCTRDGKHNKTMEHLIKMSEILNIPVEFVIPDEPYTKKCKIKKMKKILQSNLNNILS